MYFNDESGSGSYRSKGWNYEDEAWKSAEASESDKTTELGNGQAWCVSGRRVTDEYYKKVWRYSI